MYGLAHFQLYQEIHFVQLIIFTVIVQQFSVGRDFLGARCREHSDFFEGTAGRTQ